MKTCDFIVIGAGIVGITIAMELKQRFGGHIFVIEKERGAGLHASGRNSGVLHAGLYYTADSFKARFCLKGNKELKDYCKERGLPLNECGKVVVTKFQEEVEVLHKLMERGRRNGVHLRLLDEKELIDVEPHVRTVEKAIFLPDSAVVDPPSVVASLYRDAVSMGVKFLFNTKWLGFHDSNVSKTTNGDFSWGYLVNCAGLYADWVAHGHGLAKEYFILPFRGQYYRLRDDRCNLVRGNVYPVPDLSTPFLGIHFTKTTGGRVTVGPTALPVLGREQYSGWRGMKLQDTLSMAGYLLHSFIKGNGQFRATALSELQRLSKKKFYSEAKMLVPELESSDLIREKLTGIRAQLIDKGRRELVSDFLIEKDERSIHILNAVSPAFTCSFPFARYVVDQIGLS